MFEIKVEIIWRMLQTVVSQARYIDVSIYSDESVNSIFEFASINEINMLELYLNSRPRRGNTFSTKLIQVPSNS
jgi:hypothetical protein